MNAAAKKKKKGSGDGGNVIATNRKARRDYMVLDQIEAGIELQGTEVKSIRAGQVSLNESYARITKGEVYLLDMHIMPYEYGNVFNHPPRRPRKLLLHRREINRLVGLVAEKGQTLIPLKMYLKRGRVKVEIGICKGKQTHDKRETLKRKTADREARRDIAHHSR
ncbi:MAG: SsrA-binding protein SmpB [Spartobacteria bacterium]|nr:SsrA-binding protein SmpB [Spartobacteria bacterium]